MEAFYEKSQDPVAVETEAFRIVGMKKEEEAVSAGIKKKKGPKLPVISLVVLVLILAGCLIFPFLIKKDPSYMDLMSANQAPCRQFLFGTDTMGRDIFHMIWSGGRISLLIGCVSTLISTVIAILFGGLSGIAPQWADTLLMRFTEVFLSIPNLLLVILLQAILGKPNVLSVSLVIGVTSWASIAKVVRTEVRQIRGSDYVTASRCMGGGSFPCAGATPDSELSSGDSVHGGYECKKCHCGRIHFKLYGNGPASGDRFLGKYAFTFRKSAAERILVDHPDPGSLPGGNAHEHDRNGTVPTERIEPEGE